MLVGVLVGRLLDQKAGHDAEQTSTLSVDLGCDSRLENDGIARLWAHIFSSRLWVVSFGSACMGHRLCIRLCVGVIQVGTQRSGLKIRGPGWAPAVK